MGRQRGQTSLEVRNLIISHYNEGKSVRDIEKAVGRPKSTVSDVIQRYRETKSVENKPKSGRPKLFSLSDERWIVKEIKKSPIISAPKLTMDVEKHLNIHCCPQTVRNVLGNHGFHGRVARIKTFVSKVNRKKG